MRSSYGSIVALSVGVVWGVGCESGSSGSEDDGGGGMGGMGTGTASPSASAPATTGPMGTPTGSMSPGGGTGDTGPAGGTAMMPTGGTGTGMPPMPSGSASNPGGAGGEGTAGAPMNSGGAGPEPMGGNGGTPPGANGGMGGDAPGPAGAGGTPSGGAGGMGMVPAPECDPELTQANKEVVDQAIGELFVEGDLSAIDRYWADPYLQHNPVANSGVAAFRSVFSSLIQPGQAIYEPARTIGECDIVLIHGTYSSFGGTNFDMFRVEDGHLVEHWDSDFVDAGPNASGHTALDGPTEPTDLELGPENEALVLDFVETVLIGGDTGAASAYLSETLIEHNADGEDGAEAFLAYRDENSITVSQVHISIGDGNFVFTLTEGAEGGTAYGFYDLYRVENGLIVEHWDAKRPVQDTPSGLGIF